MGIIEILRRIWLFSANNIKSSESFSKQPTQLVMELNSSLWHIVVTLLSSQEHTALAHQNDKPYVRCKKRNYVINQTPLQH